MFRCYFPKFLHITGHQVALAKVITLRIAQIYYHALLCLPEET